MVYQDKTCMLFSGTVITVGRARAVVAATGGKTAIGQVNAHRKYHSVLMGRSQNVQRIYLAPAYTFCPEGLLV